MTRPSDNEEPQAQSMAYSLDGWTSDELFSEAVERRAGDAPALRLMQGTLLRAFLTAYDGAISSAAQGELSLTSSRVLAT